MSGARLGLAAAVAVVLVTLAPATAISPAAAATAACTDNVGVTIVVDFQELGGGVNVACAPGPVTSGFDALQQAGINYQTTLQLPGLLCRIAGKPSNDPCVRTSPASAYWSYWMAPRGGNWCYSNFGPGSRTPPPGTIEGWSFSLNKTGSTTPPPRMTPLPPIPGTTPHPLNANDCTTPDDIPSATTPPSNSTPPPAASPGAAPAATNTDGGPAPLGGAPTAVGDAPAATPGSGASSTGPGATNSTGTSDTPDSTPRGADPATSGSGSNVSGNAAGPLGTVDLTAGSKKGSPVGLLLAFVVVAVLGAGAVSTMRRRRRAASALSGDG